MDESNERLEKRGDMPAASDPGTKPPDGTAVPSRKIAAVRRAVADYLAATGPQDESTRA